ncbi:MAG: Acetolactate synthase large subunit IlvB1 [Firmicutes bacterium ADurb.Bin193]|nr:MAG: Acetolactate synthase large subunit IlvB1 [Firmicutes bacterium ADurb.Bin193]
MKINGSQIVIECLVEQGVDTVFGYPGGAVLNIYDALYKNSDRIKHILTAHEQGAAHAADGYARASGKVGVCIATSGPGATNLVTGIATAYMDSVPIIAITGNVGTSLLGKDSFQEADITGITAPITKHNYIVKDVKDLANTIRKAFKIARSGRPGPVLIDIPKDVSANLCEFESQKPEEIKRFVPKKEDVETARELIMSSKKPFIFAGGGVISSDACNELFEFAKRISAPVSCSLMGLGAYPATDKLFTGMLGMHGTKASNTAASNCDLFIAVGTRFSDRVISDPSKFARHAKILHIDIDPAEIDKNIKSYHSVIGDIKEVLAPLLKDITSLENPEWLDHILGLKKKFKIGHTHIGSLTPYFVMREVDKQTGGDAVITTEVGQHQMWAAQYYSYTKPRTFISSGGFGTMGYGTGASMGAALSGTGKRIVHIAGDGSFRMNSSELATMKHYNIPVIIVVMNNGTLGMVRQWQALFYGGRYSQTTLDRGPDFNILAEAYGVRSYKVQTESEFKAAFAEALSLNEPVLINTMIDIDERVLPMVPAGRPIDELILE